MRALTLTQPWASLMAVGAKKLETRGWHTYEDGWIAIHASKAPLTRELRRLCGSDPFASALRNPIAAPSGALPLGAVIAIGWLVRCHHVPAFMDKEAHRRTLVRRISDRPHEWEFGNFDAGRWAWEFAGVQAIDPIPANGRQGLWKWTAPRHILDRLKRVPAIPAPA
jgi:hypothetical protein